MLGPGDATVPELSNFPNSGDARVPTFLKSRIQAHGGNRERNVMPQVARSNLKTKSKKKKGKGEPGFITPLLAAYAPSNELFFCVFFFKKNKVPNENQIALSPSIFSIDLGDSY